MPRLPSHFWYAIVAFTIFAIYFNTPQHLHICKEQICAHSFFSPSGDNRTGNKKKTAKHCVV